ncbi:ABC transporter permease [Stieleria varia]|uniref:Lipoprotein-releasing system transmembrane protein LolE n=1 Tax=Stieleria varia TaxID=2528005 RepID=A0A5C6B011_9BACT|nr:FtsX-like permease family protein [Stieleria varia]TWU04712.1 Lipoprotein-releasing system transmembrane protein LolE [Stieleria varia]
MYRWLLCFRYLKTRYIALASIISVTLGVATLIVVNAVMSGFSVEMHERLHGLASDIMIECHSSQGMPDPDAHLAEIRRVCGNDIEGASVSVSVPAMLGLEYNGQRINRHVNLIGLDPVTYDTVSDFGKYLLHPENKENVSFELHENGYAPDRPELAQSGWEHRRLWTKRQKENQAENERLQKLMTPSVPMAPPETLDGEMTADITAGPSFSPAMPGGFPGMDMEAEQQIFDPEKDQLPGIILGISTCSTRYRDADGNVVDHYYSRPGDDVRMMFPNAAQNPKVMDQKFTVVDLYESGMSEYDSTFAFVPLDKLQEYRGMIDPMTGVRSVTTIQLKLKPESDLNAVRDALRLRFPAELYAYNIQTWRDLQGPLLSAVRLETTILNILLFLIIAVAGFGILATFFMIVVEKTRDIGTLKALGASGRGVMSIFLSYGLLLGCVGSGAGLIGGVVFVKYINKVASVIEKITGQEVFDPTVYYFTEIPTIIDPFTLVWVMCGAVAIAAMASVLPALRAARMHPVRALRFE